VGRAGMIINLAGLVWASLGARGPARHGPLTNPGRASTVLIRAGPSRAWVGTARPFGHLCPMPCPSRLHGTALFDPMPPASLHVSDPAPPHACGPAPLHAVVAAHLYVGPCSSPRWRPPTLTRGAGDEDIANTHQEDEDQSIKSVPWLASIWFL
jgi:hypothetical protein